MSNADFNSQYIRLHLEGKDVEFFIYAVSSAAKGSVGCCEPELSAPLVWDMVTGEEGAEQRAELVLVLTRLR